MKPSLTYELPDRSSNVRVEVSEFGTHSEQVLSWREAEFKRMGFVDFIADFLASTRIDLRQMEKLIDAGCEHRVAAEILIGTYWNGEDDTWILTDEAAYFAREDEDQSVAAA